MTATRRPLSPALRAARTALRNALVRYQASLLAEFGVEASDPSVTDALANLRASDDAATRAAAVCGFVEASS